MRIERQTCHGSVGGTLAGRRHGLFYGLDDAHPCLVLVRPTANGQPFTRRSRGVFMKIGEGRPLKVAGANDHWQHANVALLSA